VTLPPVVVQMRGSVNFTLFVSDVDAIDIVTITFDTTGMKGSMRLMTPTGAVAVTNGGSYAGSSPSERSWVVEYTAPNGVEFGTPFTSFVVIAGDNGPPPMSSLPLTVVINVAQLIDPPVTSFNPNPVTVPDQSSVLITLASTDTYGYPLSFTMSALPSNGGQLFMLNDSGTGLNISRPISLAEVFHSSLGSSSVRIGYRSPQAPPGQSFGARVDEFAFTVSNSGFNSVRTVPVSVTYVDFPCTAFVSPASITIPETVADQDVVFTVTGQDANNGQALSAYLTSMPTRGVLKQGGSPVGGFGPTNLLVATTNGKWDLTFTIPGLTHGVPLETISMNVTDGSSTASVSITISVTFVNFAPLIFAPSVITGLEDSYIDFLVQGFDFDAGNTVALVVDTPPTRGTLAFADGSGALPLAGASISDMPLGSRNFTLRFTYDPLTDGAGYDTFKLKVLGLQTLVFSTIALTTVNIIPVNHRPVVATSPTSALTMPQNTVSSLIRLTALDVDSTDVLSIIITELPASGWLLYANGSVITRTPPFALANNVEVAFKPVDYEYSAAGVPYTTFSFAGYDGIVQSTVMTIDIFVEFTFFTPILLNTSFTFSTLADTSVLMTFSIPSNILNPNNEVLFLSLSSNVQNGSLYAYDGNDELDLLIGSTPFTIDYDVNSTTSFTLRYHPYYFPPLLSFGMNFDRFEFFITNGVLDSVVASVNLDVLYQNFEPTVIDLSFSTLQPSPVAFQLTGAQDKNLDDITLFITSYPDAVSVGSLYYPANTNSTLASTTTGIVSPYLLSFTPTVAFYGEVTFGYVAFDGQAYGPEATVTITVVPKLARPPTTVLTPSTITMGELSSSFVTIGGYSLDGNPTTAYVTALPSTGSMYTVSKSQVGVYSRSMLISPASLVGYTTPSSNVNVTAAMLPFSTCVFVAPKFNTTHPSANILEVTFRLRDNGGTFPFVPNFDVEDAVLTIIVTKVNLSPLAKVSSPNPAPMIGYNDVVVTLSGIVRNTGQPLIPQLIVSPRFGRISFVGSTRPLVPGDFLSLDFAPADSSVFAWNITYVPDRSVPYKKSFDFFFFRVFDNITYSSEYSVAITMFAVNEPPVITLEEPIASAIILESRAIASSITVTDASDIPQLPVCTLTVSVSASAGGILELTSLTGIAYNSSTDISGTNLLFSGIPSAVSSALATMTYTPQNRGDEVITIFVSDNGNSGLGGELTDSATVRIKVEAVSDKSQANVANLSGIAVGSLFFLIIAVAAAYYRVRKLREYQSYYEAFSIDAFESGQVMENPLYGPQLSANPCYAPKDGFLDERDFEADVGGKSAMQMKTLA
jgi:hypothetical protein